MEQNNHSITENPGSLFVNPPPVYCGFPDHINEEIIFWIEGVLLSVVGLFGVLGNSVTFYVLSLMPSECNIFNKLLMQLVTGDSISIVLIFIDYSLRKSFQIFNKEDFIYVDIWPTIIYPIIKISFTWIMCCTIAITIERYLAICHPFLVRQNPTKRTATQRVDWRRKTTAGSNLSTSPSRKRLYEYTLTVVLISVFSNIPIFWEFTTGVDSETNRKRIEITSLRIDENYITYFKNGFESIILMLCPFIAMVCLNSKIIYTLRKRYRNSSLGVGFGKNMKNEMNLARVLVAMDIVFMVCNLGRVIVNVWDLIHLGKIKECLRLGLPYRIPSWVSTMTSLNHFLHVLSASLNLIIISITGSQFRGTLISLLNRNNEEEKRIVEYECSKGDKQIIRMRTVSVDSGCSSNHQDSPEKFL